MVANYFEIEDPKETARLERELSRRLRRELPFQETRTIGYPQGSFSASVRFRRRRGDDVFWWFHGRTSRAVQNLFGEAAPRTRAKLNISVQLNVSAARFSRNFGGAFLQNKATGAIVVAHRGIVTHGHGRIRKDLLFAEMGGTLEAETSKGVREFMPIDEMQSASLVAQIHEFSVQIRKAIQQITPEVQRKSTHTVKNLRKGDSTCPPRLREYFHEFSGYRVLGARSESIADCYHGTVVRALRNAIGSARKPLKNREIDLVSLKNQSAFIFEVKTSSDSQSIYTAVGQLFVHAAALKGYIGNKEPVKVIVLPSLPTERLRRVISDRLRIRVLTFIRSPQGHISFRGLDRLT